MEDKLDANVRCSYLGQAIRFWLGTRTEALASLLIFSTVLLATVISRGKISGGQAGLTVTYALEVMEGLTWMVFMACNLETNTVCLERIMEWWKLPQESRWESGGDDDGQVGSGDHRQESRFPIRSGRVTFDRFSVR